jgi:hypothetical protein
VASAAGFAVGNVIRIDNEFLYQPAAAPGTFVPVTCGKEGSAQVAHASGTTVITGLPSDFPASPVGAGQIIPFAVVTSETTYGTAGAITVPVNIARQTVYLKTGTAGAMTLALPTADIKDTELEIIAQDAEAYTVTTPATGYNGATHIATFNGVAGSSCVLRAVGATWFALRLTGVALT